MYINLTWNCRICVVVAFLCLLFAFLPNFYHFGAKWPTTPCEDKDWVHSFTLKLECHNSYNKLWLCNSANCDIAWCNKNNPEWGFCVFFLKKKPVSLKNGFKKPRRVVFKKKGFSQPWLSFNPFLRFSLIARSGTRHVVVSLNGCPAPT